MIQHCPVCLKKTRVRELRKKIKGRIYWVSSCLQCKTPLDLDEVETETTLEKEAKERNKFNGWS